jgi:type III secretion protein L
MTRLVLARAAGLALEVDEPIVAAEALPAVGDAVTTLRRLETLRADLLRRGRQRLERARRDGLQQGREQAERDASLRLAGSLAELDATLRAERTAREAAVVELALAVVARIAGELGDAAVVAALARRALADLDTESPVRLRVHPSVAAAVTAAPAAQAGPPVLEVLADPALRPLDCEIDSIDGVVEVGLEVQLDAVRAALSRTPGASS